LLPRDIDTKSGVVTVHDGKGDKRRHSHIGPVWMSLVEKWLTKRRAIGLTGRQPLFCTISSGVRKGKTLEPGRPLHQAQVRALLRRLGKRADIEKRVHPHGLRHAFAVDLVRSGKALKPIQDVLGHSRLQTTEEYLRVLSPEESLRHIAEGRD
ncbi:MAG: tyrosine-type recombinase/integrase, partial [Acidobacteriota bacterium]